jgi:hypothetical protein
VAEFFPGFGERMFATDAGHRTDVRTERVFVTTVGERTSIERTCDRRHAHVRIVMHDVAQHVTTLRSASHNVVQRHAASFHVL